MSRRPELHTGGGTYVSSENTVLVHIQSNVISVMSVEIIDDIRNFGQTSLPLEVVSSVSV